MLVGVDTRAYRGPEAPLAPPGGPAGVLAHAAFFLSLLAPSQIEMVEVRRESRAFVYRRSTTPTETGPFSGPSVCGPDPAVAGVSYGVHGVDEPDVYAGCGAAGMRRDADRGGGASLPPQFFLSLWAAEPADYEGFRDAREVAG